jgi:hypothetical protein
VKGLLRSLPLIVLGSEEGTGKPDAGLVVGSEAGTGKPDAGLVVGSEEGTGKPDAGLVEEVGGGI